MEQLVQEIITSLESFKDPQRLEFASKSYPTAMKVIGVTVPNEKIVLKELRNETKKFTGREKIAVAIALSDTGIFECQHIALEYLGKDKKALKELTSADLEKLNRNMDNWVSVDCYAGYLFGYAWREGVVSTESIKELYQSDNFWNRRIAIVSTVALNQKARGGLGDAKRTLEVCELAVDDHQDMITKALSWALRELAKIDAEPVADFIAKFEDRLHKRVLREVKKKLETGRKN